MTAKAVGSLPPMEGRALSSQLLVLTPQLPQASIWASVLSLFILNEFFKDLKKKSIS